MATGKCPTCGRWYPQRPVSPVDRYHTELLGQRLRQARSDSGLTVRQITDRAGVSSSQIYRLEHGEQRTREFTLWRLACALGYLDAPQLFAEFVSLAGPAIAPEKIIHKERIAVRSERGET